MDSASPPLVLVVTGLQAEARLARGPGCRVVAGGGDRAGLEARLAGCDELPVRAVVSFGLAGGLAPHLRVGDVVLATAVRDVDGGEIARDGTGEEWRTLLAALRPIDGVLVGSDVPAATVAGKAALRARTGAVAIDMESHAAAAYAARRGLPYGAVRIVSDGAEHAIPPVAAAAMRPDGSIDLLGLVAGLARDPGQIPGLIATARNAAVAFRSLRRVRRLLGPHFGLHL